MRYENLIYFLFNLDIANLFALLFYVVQIRFWKTYPFSLLFYVVLGIYRLLFNSFMSCEHYIRNQQSQNYFPPWSPPKSITCRFSRNASFADFRETHTCRFSRNALTPVSDLKNERPTGQGGGSAGSRTMQKIAIVKRCKNVDSNHRKKFTNVFTITIFPHYRAYRIGI